MRKRKNWLHWMGNTHYSVANFIKEARKIGVSRRVPLKILRNMEWGDRIYLVSRVPGLTSPVVFGYFEVDRLVGIQIDEMPEELRKKVENVEDPDSDFMFVEKRGCGFVVIGAFYATSLGVEELAEYADKDTMVKGGLKIYPKPWVTLFKMPPFRGYREFNADEFHKDINEGQKKLKRYYYK